MNVNFEFLDTEAIENVITCLNYKMDKVVFLGFEETIDEKWRGTERFLKERCGVQVVDFIPMSHTNLDSIIRTMRWEIEQEYEKNNKCFFDITGGEGLALLTFGIISKELNVPMHLYDVRTCRLLEYCKSEAIAMSRNVPAHKAEWNLDVFVEMQGGVVDYKRGKSHKMEHDAKDLADIKALWEFCKAYEEHWNAFSGILASLNKRCNGLTYTGTGARVLKAINNQPGFGENGSKDYELFHQMLEACVGKGFLTELVYDGQGCVFTYKNEFVKSCLGEAGCVLEQRVFLEEKKKAGVIDCRTGVHIDWDGKIKGTPGGDVLNEVDVLVLNGYVPTFISCKAGNTKKLKQDALYELDAVASRFGGKYAKKVLALAEPWSDGHLNRAKEMGIEVRVVE